MQVKIKVEMVQTLNGDSKKIEKIYSSKIRARFNAVCHLSVISAYICFYRHPFPQTYNDMGGFVCFFFANKHRFDE